MVLPQISHLKNKLIKILKIAHIEAHKDQGVDDEIINS
jgi:hypothetical protein